MLITSTFSTTYFYNNLDLNLNNYFSANTPFFYLQMLMYFFFFYMYIYLCFIFLYFFFLFLFIFVYNLLFNYLLKRNFFLFYFRKFSSSFERLTHYAVYSL